MSCSLKDTEGNDNVANATGVEVQNSLLILQTETPRVRFELLSMRKFILMQNSDRYF